MNLQVIDNISIKEPSIDGQRVKVIYNIDGQILTINFRYYNVEIKRKYAQILSLMPVVNYSLFVKSIKIDFPITEEDSKFLYEVLRLNSIEIYINKLIKRPEFFKDEYIPKKASIDEASWAPKLIFENGNPWEKIDTDRNRVAIMSSGGKESLLTYGLMNEIGAEVYPIYFNESGSHWKTAIPAYRYMSEKDPRTLRIWSDIDRFYRRINEMLPIFKKGALEKWSDTYPIQLYIFPVYIFASFPYIEKYAIGNIMKGDEYDDPKNFEPLDGIKHFYGILDQTKFFDDMLTQYIQSVGLNLRFFSAVRHITGLVEERILFHRYPELLKLQRSCHSCHYEDGEIVPCGRCSKCNGILLFLKANGIDPSIIKYKDIDVKRFMEEYPNRLYRIDESEKLHAMYKVSGGKIGRRDDSVEKIHFCKDFCPEETIPEEFRDKLIKIFKEYTIGIERD